jgi:hypothetical protein
MKCDNIHFKGFGTLPNLKKVDMVHGSISDADLANLSKIDSLSIYGCNINGSGLKHLNVTDLTIYECPIEDEHVHIKKGVFNMFRCRNITIPKKRELRALLGDKFRTE